MLMSTVKSKMKYGLLIKLSRSFYVFKKKKNKCVFCGTVSEDNIFEKDCGYHCSNLDRCEERLVNLHVRKNPTTKQEAFSFLTHFQEHDVFLSSINSTVSRDWLTDAWYSTVKITGVILVGRSFLCLKDSELYEREFPTTSYSCKIPVNINLRFNDAFCQEKARSKTMGRAQFFGAYHENYGCGSNTLGGGPIVISMDLYAPAAVIETISAEVKRALIVKNIYDSASQESLKSRDFFQQIRDRNFLANQGLRGLNYWDNTKFKCEFADPVKDVDCPESEKSDGAGVEFLDIKRWSLESKI